MAGPADRNFILSQGLEAPEAASCSPVSSSLRFQPRVVGTLTLAGTILQTPAIFVFLAVVLWWSALVPRWNPFDHTFNATLGRRPGAPKLGPAAAPRRFSQGMAATFATGIASSLLAGWHVTAWTLEGFMLAAVTALVVGRLCFGSFIYYTLKGQVAFAVRTLPWVRAVKTR
ncbi:MAG TPA: DUF4395 family protein [Candidatus Saccharimonadales bacterium]|nr:DUF4395 family protein [Candidatus Saccharimonadales bacterium]